MTTKSNLTNSLRLTPLSACLALAFAGGALATTSANKALPTGLHAASRMQMMHTARPRPAHSQQRAKAPGPAALDPVLNCLDDSSAGSLRTVVMGAASGDTIDLSGLTPASCTGSKITLLLGEIAFPLADLTFTGPPLLPNGSPALTIDANQNGRAIDVTTGTLEVNNLAIINGKVSVDDGTASGGCLYAYLDATLTNTTISGCSVSGDRATGGGFYTYYGGLTLVNSTVTNNTATATSTAAGTETSVQAAGGGVYSFTAISVTNSTVSGNQAVVGTIANPVTTTGYGFGGGIALSPAQVQLTNTISGSTVSGNSADIGGGIEADGNLTITNSTVSGNSASIVGGAMRAYFVYALDLQNSTIAFNNSNSIGGILVPYAGTLTVNSTIVSNNTEVDTTNAADLGAAFAINAAGANSLITSSDAVITFDNPPLTVDPVLLALANNGGPTQTHALIASSPAVATGNNAAVLTTDQRGPGFPRSIDGLTDIGAFELGNDRIFANGFE
jgi:hypothetical protein